jgi:hypothetical protein
LRTHGYWRSREEGAIDWAATTADLEAKQIELRGANRCEAPGAYTRFDEMLAAHAQHRLDLRTP